MTASERIRQARQRTQTTSEMREYYQPKGEAMVTEYWGVWPEHTLAELEAMPTLAQGQADDLKWESDTRRVWLSRCGVEDGEPWDNKVTVEVLIAGSWVEVEWWEAR